MFKKRILLHTIESLFVVLFGTFLHFAYSLSGNNAFVGLFSAVNESVWEHLKLITMPYLLLSLIEWVIFGKKLIGFVAAKLGSLVCGMLFTVTAFYTYTGIIGDHILVVDILIFVISVMVSLRTDEYILNRKIFYCKKHDLCAFLFIILLLLCFWSFTFAPPQIPLFSPNV